ncbi:NAD(P)-binding protein [Eremomyces bilateralis CBS 781.70]|uniref:NAD(P)-binding protein n=1 Tax=Eremomyces bilateralis CBS 781.70 TaxID=1392243 RepID=A0A6G1GG79_9PEZI|nr:NAD(P)-binding protein [Eremomyces bilateralis CBS 781.70]KAF1816879.1 NAD(P)-binding protein [Eremomyces bilateralis CBS 781.70]
MSSSAAPLTPGVAFITGGARGLGHATALAFAQHGARAIVLADIHDDATMTAAAQAVTSLGAACLPLRCDVSQESEVAAAIATTVATYGRIDYAANFAAIMGPVDGIGGLKLEHWERVMRVNSTGLMLCVKHELAQLMKQVEAEQVEGKVPGRQVGSIVNCGSINSILGGARAGTYTVAKHAVLGITRVAAGEGRKHGIRVNAIGPGVVHTQFSETAIIGGEQVAGPTNQGLTKLLEKQGREILPEEIGEATVLLSSSAMSAVNGHLLPLDAGLTSQAA